MTTEGVPLAKIFGKLSGFDTVLKIVRVTKMDHEGVETYFVVDDSCINLNGSLHGGFSAMLVDVITTLAFVAQDPKKAGVSLDLNVSYLSTCAVGDKIRVVARALKTGRTVGFSTVDIIRDKDNVLIATGRHTKAFAAPKL